MQYLSVDHGGQGLFSCPGFYDDDHYRFCNFSSMGGVARPVWKPLPGEASSSSSSAAAMLVD